MARPNCAKSSARNLDVCSEKGRNYVIQNVRLSNTEQVNPIKAQSAKKRDHPSHGDAHGLCSSTTFPHLFPARCLARVAQRHRRQKTTPPSIQLRVYVCLPSMSSNPPTAVNPRNLRSVANCGMTGKWKGRFEMSRQRLYLATEVYLGRRRPVPLLQDR